MSLGLKHEVRESAQGALQLEDLRNAIGGI